MTLYEILKDVATCKLPDCDVGFITDKSQNVEKGCIFVCIKGKNFDGHLVAKDMLDKGAVAVIVEHDLGLERQIIVENSRYAFAVISANFFKNADKKMKIIGVTGTNGKTTITTVLKKILTDFGYKTGLIGTSQNEIGEEILSTEKTTPEAFELFELINKMQKSGCEYVVMEVSSQALEQFRIGKMEFELGIFTNLTQDHLDVHGDMENYYSAKKMLFSHCKNALINRDDDYGKRYFNEISVPKRKAFFSIENEADYYADNAKMNAEKSTFWFCDGVKAYFSQFNIPAQYNISNAVSVLAGLDILGFDIQKATRFLADFKGVKGRLEVIQTGKDFTVICDYAHTPDALENVLSGVKKFTKNRLICLFGCGGNRDRKKRPLMCKAASKFADFLIITSDNPRNENPKAIIEDILVGLAKEKTDFVSIESRKEAIYFAIKKAKKGDVIVLAGKGHEDYQILENNVKIHFDEREIVKEALLKI